ncbi:hypothetical protein [Frateuria sp. STR12]|uniref:hypothetical protein n=1 Tax=Frateuria hangzhouensis TaxID=2995589 RepID=UPI002260836A|nr:hypothetical protein [Frateuria sp. STR12]MCX7515030.1 hypothetical protein [Frateuria sp. STR12]
MQQRKPPAEAAPARADAWYRQPVLWLGAVILVASLAGCIWTIVLSSRYADVPVEDAHPHTLLDMPVHGADAAKAGAGSGKSARASDAAAGEPGRTP